MAVDLVGIPLYFIDNVDLVGANYKHLRPINDRDLGVHEWHTIMALTRVSPTVRKDPGSCAKTEGIVSPKGRKEGNNMKMVPIAQKPWIETEIVNMVVNIHISLSHPSSSGRYATRRPDTAQTPPVARHTTKTRACDASCHLRSLRKTCKGWSSPQS